MNCTEVRPLLSAYYDGEATPEEHKTVERHLATCEDCRRALAEYRAIGGGIRAMPVPLPPAGLRRDVWRAIEAQQPGRTVAPASPGGNVTVLKRQERTHDTWGFPILRKGGWGKAIPAFATVAAMLLLFVVAIVWISNRPSSAFAAAITDPTPVADYRQTIHVQFKKRVNSSEARQFTLVRIQGSAQDGTEVEATKTFDSANNVLAITPREEWKEGTTYEIWVEANKIGTGTRGEFLADEPFPLSFDTIAYTPTPTTTPTVTNTASPTPIPTDTPEPTQVAQEPSPAVETPVAQASPTAPPSTATNTWIPPTATPTSEPSDTPEPTRTATTEPTDTPEPEPTGTPSSTATPRKGTPTPGKTATPKVTPTATPPCPVMPVSGFGKLWTENAAVRRGLGCPRADEIGIQRAAHQRFQGGYMFWRGDTGKIFVFVGTANTGYWEMYDDTWKEGDPEPVETPPSGRYAPVRGFGKVWRAYPGLRQALGWAVEPESGLAGAWQPFAQGNMLWTSDKEIRVLYDDGTWASYPDTFDAQQATPTPRRPGE